jgi:phage replication-related protein YjqB (UPF0714/DUF867 family)
MRSARRFLAHLRGWGGLSFAFNLFHVGAAPRRRGTINTLESAVKTFLRTFVAASLATVLSAPAFGCVPTLPSVDNISVSLLASVNDEIQRREFVEISDDLATSLGISPGDIDSDEEAPNPQIRVRIQSTPAGSGVTSNNAIFTVVGINATGPGTDLRIWVYGRKTGTDKDAGQFKLFAKSDGSVYATPDTTPADGILDDILVRAFSVPVSSRAFTNTSNVTTTTTYYCEPAASQSYLEKAVREADDTVVAFAPHGGNIETGTSPQAYTFASTLETLSGTPVNVWNLEGKWGNNQTFERWHATSTSIDIASYPGLTALLPAGGQFERAVSFHGFSGTSSAQACSSGPHAPNPRLLYQVIIGGGAVRNLKCAIAKSLDDAMVAAGRTDDIGIAIRDGAGNINIPDNCGRNVSQSGLDGTHDDNIVNRLASEGGIQLEQSKVLRDDATLANLMATAAADGFADFMADDATDYCSGL